MYKIGKIPAVLKKAKITNQKIEPFLADFHIAKSFQVAVHKRITIKTR